MAAEESRRLAVEPESQMAELLAQEADRGDELEAKVTRSDKAAARWERKYPALKEGVGTLVDSAKLERDQARQERTVLSALIEEHAALKLELKAAQEDAKLNLRESVRLQHELSAALEADHTDRIRTATARDCGALSGADEDEHEDEEEDDDNDDDEYEGAEDDDGDDSDASAERLREELLAFAGGRSSTGSCASVTGDAPRRPPASYYNDAGELTFADHCCSESTAGKPHSAVCNRRSGVESNGVEQPFAFDNTNSTFFITPPPESSVRASHAHEASAVDGGGDDEGTLEDASVFAPPPVAGTPTKGAASDPRAPGAGNPGSPLNMDFLSRRSESKRALADSVDFASGLVEAGAVMDGAGVTERAALGLQPLPPGEAIWASSSGRWEPCTALLQVAADPIMHLVRQATGGARGAVHLLLPEWAVRPFAAQEINMHHSFKERPLHVPWAPSHIHQYDAHGGGGARWLPVWVPPPSHPMHKALWSGAGLDADGGGTGHLAMVSSDLRCSVVPASRLLTAEEGEARGITLNEVAASTVGRRVMARSTSVHLKVRETPSRGSHGDDGSAVGLSAAANERRIERDEGLCDNLMKSFAVGCWRASSHAGSSARTQCSSPDIRASSWKTFRSLLEYSLMTRFRRRRFMLASSSSFSVVCDRTLTRTRALGRRLWRLGAGARSATRRRHHFQRLRGFQCPARPWARARRALAACA